jgi:nucleoside-diphosphate-sugar epimerase
VRVFLTGATGFVGGVLAKQLVAAGHDVRAVVRDPAKASALAAMGVRLFPGDVTNKDSMRAPMTGADAVFHIAGWYKVGVRDKSPAVATNVHGTRNVLELMQELGVPKGVYTSTLAVNSDTRGRLVDETYQFTGTHLSVYDRTKAEAHAIAESFISRGLPLVIVQPGLIYGPGDTSSVRTTFVQFLERRLPPLPRGTAFCWAHVEDIARGHVLALERGKPGRNYFLAGPVHTLVEGIQIASTITGIPAPRMTLPAGLLRASSLLMGLVERVVPVPPEFTAEGLRVLAGTTYIGSNAKAKTELGWTVRPLREGLVETLADIGY